MVKSAQNDPIKKHIVTLHGYDVVKLIIACMISMMAYPNGVFQSKGTLAEIDLKCLKKTYTISISSYLITHINKRSSYDSVRRSKMKYLTKVIIERNPTEPKNITYMNAKCINFDIFSIFTSSPWYKCQLCPISLKRMNRTYFEYDWMKWPTYFF